MSDNNDDRRKKNPLTKIQTIYENKKLEINKQKIFWHKWRESLVKWDCQKKPQKKNNN